MIVTYPFLAAYYDRMTHDIAPRTEGGDMTVSDSFEVPNDFLQLFTKHLKHKTSKGEMESISSVFYEIDDHIASTIEITGATGYSYPTIKLVGNPEGVMNITFNYSLSFS